jgi:hypothetical protein
LTAGKAVLELGSGVGLCGLAHAAFEDSIADDDIIKPLTVFTMTDGSEAVIEAIQRNISLNQLSSERRKVLRAQQLDWGDLLANDGDALLLKQHPVLLMCDCMYSLDAIRVLTDVLYRHLIDLHEPAATHREAFVVLTKRRQDSFDYLMQRFQWLQSMSSTARLLSIDRLQLNPSSSSSSITIFHDYDMSSVYLFYLH